MSKIDGRSADGRFLRRVRAELAEHVGGKPSATQHALIDRIAWLRLRIAAMESTTPAGGQMNECATRTYLAWTGTLSRMLRDLGPPVAAKSAKRTLADIRADRAAA